MRAKKAKLICALLLGSVGVGLLCVRDVVLYSYQIAKSTEARSYHADFGIAGLCCIVTSIALILMIAGNKSSTIR